MVLISSISEFGLDRVEVRTVRTQNLPPSVRIQPLLSLVLQRMERSFLSFCVVLRCVAIRPQQGIKYVVAWHPAIQVLLLPRFSNHVFVRTLVG